MKRDSSNDTSKVPGAETRKKVFIFTPRPDALASAQAFLRNRGWTVLATNDLRDGVADCLRTKPDFVLLCADHPNQSIRSLPKLLQQALSARLILFADSNTGVMAALADETNCPYTLHPPVSGPAIERAIWRVLRDESRMTENEFETSSHRVAGSYSMGEHDAIAYRPTHGMGAGDVDPDILISLHKQEAQSEATGHHVPRRSVPHFEQEASPARSMNAQMSRWGQTPVMQGTAGGWARLNEESDAILITGTDAALADARRKISRGTVADATSEAVEVISRIGCIDIESPRFSGYLLMAWGANRTLDESMMEAMRSRLVEFMHVHGEPFEAADAIGLHVVDVTFESWAIKQSDFLRKSVHEGHELAVAFFPKKARPIRLEPSARADMVRVTIDDLRGDTPVEFDVYLHFPLNDKYILYTPEGASFYQVQKDRLKKKGVNSVHLKKQSAVDLRRYRIQNFLNELIGAAVAEPAA